MDVTRFKLAEAGPADLADPAINVALAWVAAADAADREDLEDLSAPDVVVGGPRGEARGREQLAPWLDRAGIALRPTEVHARGGAVVLGVDARWGADGPWQAVALRFAVADGLAAAVHRHDRLPEALAAAGL
jgi:hypothetical protein